MELATTVPFYLQTKLRSGYVELKDFSPRKALIAGR